MPRIFTDNMVLQQAMPIAVWGWAAMGEQVTVTLGDTSAVAKAGDDGKWRVDLPAMSADGKTYELTVKGESGQPRTLRNKEGLPAVCFRLELNAEVAERLSLRDTPD